MSQQVDQQGVRAADVAVVGMGYVGLTLTVAFSEAGLRVAGYEVDAGRRQALQQAQVPFLEPGLQEAISRSVGDRLVFVESLPDPLPRAVILCVGTPVEPGTHEIRLEFLHRALDDVLPKIDEDTLLVVRSTVPVGTTRTLIFNRLAEHISEPLVAYAPERTIQGIALEELRSLPQVIGGGPRARGLAADLFRNLTSEIVEVSSLDVAELVKLVNNAHTDLIYGFGNEVALISSALGVDADEVIMAANVKYPRPDLSKPGFVGGSCLTKDPYILLESARAHGYEPAMVAAARALNEHVPVHVAQTVLEELERSIDPADATVLVSGLAYKGSPETDDVRGSAAPWLIEALSSRVGKLLGHDFVVDSSTISSLGLEPTGLEDGCARANALIVLNNHEEYSRHSAEELGGALQAPGVIYDLWAALASANGAAASGRTYLTLADERSRR